MAAASARPIANSKPGLRRAVDGEGEVLEILVQPQRDKAAAVGCPETVTLPPSFIHS